jgi:hypothetical protein
MASYNNTFADQYFSSFGPSEHTRLAQLLNEIAYRPNELEQLLSDERAIGTLSPEETSEMRRALTIIEDRLSPEALKKLPGWFWDDPRFYANPRKPDFVVNNNSPALKQRLMYGMLEEASNAFLQRSTFFDQHSLQVM